MFPLDQLVYSLLSFVAFIILLSFLLEYARGD